MSAKGMACLRVLYAFRLLIADSGGVGLTCIAQFVGCARTTVDRQMKIANDAGLVEIKIYKYKNGFARRYHLTSEGVELMSIPF